MVHPCAGIIVSDALAISTAICTAIMLLLLAAAPFLLSCMANMGPEMLCHASDYIRIRSLGLPFALGYSVMQGSFLACRAPRVPLVATGCAAIFNLIGDIVLCQGFGLGVRGAAAATTGAPQR
jgi:Na+-driven multidrug efflux pump